jgi:two-component system, LytTR family, response regulator
MKCLIVDDDPLICDLLEHFCSKIDAIKQIDIANDGYQSINLINNETFDLILLDYDLPDLKGSDILSVVSQSTKVIMVTSQKDFASESYNYSQIVDFIVKPLDFVRFAKAIQRVQQQRHIVSAESDAVFVKEGTKLVKVDFKDVLFVKSAANYTEIYFIDRKMLTLMPLKELEKNLPNFFQRIHRSTIVNVSRVDEISAGLIQIGEYELSVSESYQEILLSRIKRLN